MSQPTTKENKMSDIKTETTKHTTGPWRVRNPHEGDGKYIPNVFSGDDNWQATEICVLYGAGKDLEYKAECVANANLIAAAPELLEALKAYRCLDTLAETHTFAQCQALADAAIKKAETV